MGGRDKAWLRAPGGQEALIERLLRLAAELELDAIVVGGNAPPGVVRLRDEPGGVGPIGGLCALLAHAQQTPAVALACDLPYLDRALLDRLVRTPSSAPVLAARDPRTGKWQPLFARYDSARVLPALLAAVRSGVRSMQTVLRELEVAELTLSEDELARLHDWDAPSDITGCA